MSLLIVLLIACGQDASLDKSQGDWPAYGADNANTKFSSLNQINRNNVKDLQIAWRWQSLENQVKKEGLRASIYQVTPLAVEGVLYVSTTLSQVAALNGTTGEPIWTYDPKSYESKNGPAHGAYIHRGVSYWKSGDDRRVIFGTADARLIALNARTGEPIPEFGDNGSVDLTKGLRRPIDSDSKHYSVSTPPIIVRDVIVVGSSITDAKPMRMRPPGDVRGFDVRTGEQLWTFHTIPQEGEFGNETWEEDSWQYTGNTNVWTRMSADEALGYVYLPVSTPTSDWYGGNRPGDNLFAESLVCLNAQTGERIWHFQMVHHGVWDYDLPAAPNLVDIKVDGRPVKAVAQVSKQGFVYVFDRVTGEPVWPIEERPVPQSTVPGEKTAATQPFPTKPAPFDRQGITQDDLIDFTAELRAEAEEIFSGVDGGPLFTPPTMRGWVYLPGPLGGANWHGAAFDGSTGMLYVPSITYPVGRKIVKADTSESDIGYWWERVSIRGPQGLPLVKPPYGRLTAINLNTGEQEWMIPLGEGPRHHPALKDLNLPRLGWPLRGSPLLTEELIFIGQEGKYWFYVPALVGGQELSKVESDEIVKFEPKFFVYDKVTGELIHSLDLPLNITGAPMTYMARGKQYIAFAVGGVKAPAEIIALSLP